MGSTGLGRRRPCPGVKAVVIAVVLAGVTLSALGATGSRIDAAGVVLLALVMVVGLGVVATAMRAGGEKTSPVACGQCGRLKSRHEPYCKHCGARASR